MQSEKKPDKKRISSDDLQKQHEKKEISRQKLMSDRGSVPRMIYKCDKCRTTPTNIYDILHAFILGYQFPPGFPSVNIDEVKFDKNVYQFVLKVRDFWPVGLVETIPISDINSSIEVKQLGSIRNELGWEEWKDVYWTINKLLIDFSHQMITLFGGELHYQESQKIGEKKRIIKLPKTIRAREKWENAYKVIVDIREEYKERWKFGDVESPTLSYGDYCDALVDVYNRRPSEKTISKIIAAGDEGLLD